MTHIDKSAEIDPAAMVGEGTSIWGLAQVREHARIGRECVIGRGAYVGAEVHIGDRVKVQNNALIYEPARIGDGVFVGPAAIFTNDLLPRAVTPQGHLKSPSDWSPVGVTVLEGASVGAGVVCVAPATIGRWAMIGAGSTVVDDVPDFALVVGTPARQIGWVGRSGERLRPDGLNQWRCPKTGSVFVQRDGGISELVEPA